MLLRRAPALLLPIGRAGDVFAPALGRRHLLFVAALLGHARGVAGLRVLHPGRLITTARVLAGGAPRSPVLRARLLLPLPGRGPTRNGASLRHHTAIAGLAFDAFGLGR